MQLAFDSPSRYGKSFDWHGYTVHDAANLLLRYLLQLPQPVIPLHLYNSFCSPLSYMSTSTTTFEPETAISEYRSLITKMPPLYRQILLYLLDLLAAFACESNLNKMTTAKLAAIFQPGILSRPGISFSPNEERRSQDVLVFLVENQERFLFGTDGLTANGGKFVGRRECRWISAQVPGGLTLVDDLCK